MSDPEPLIQKSSSLRCQRNELLEQLSHSLQVNTKQHLTGLIIIDIREFRELNRSFGEACGNLVLEDIATRLQSLAADNLSYFYLGNDEFGIIIPELKSPGFAVLAAEQIQALFKHIFEWQNHTLKITVNCGVAYNYDAHSDVYKMLYDAEIALRHAKTQNQPYQLLGKNEQERADQFKWELLNHLHVAIRDEELTLYYQPKIKLHQQQDSTQARHAEVLVRWETDSHGIITPQTTLPLIEHLGSETELIRWLINTALKNLSVEDQSGSANNVSVNIPATSITSKVLYQIISEALDIWNVKPQQLTLEITEDVLIKDKELAFDYLSKVRDTGVRISIDDFGTGYSSLAYFKHIPADELKIDRAFINNILTDEANRSLVKLIIDLAQAFKLDVVAEGVEDQATLDLLRDMGCDYAQGFLISHPMPYREYQQWLKRYK